METHKMTAEELWRKVGPMYIFDGTDAEAIAIIETVINAYIATLTAEAEQLREILEKVEVIRQEILNDEMSDLENGHLRSCLAKHARKLLSIDIKSALQR